MIFFYTVPLDWLILVLFDRGQYLKVFSSNFSLFVLGDPNNESPLNSEAANLWCNQPVFKQKLLEAYNKPSINS
jgi:hypothetical protein